MLFRKLLQSKEEEQIQRKRKSSDENADRKAKRRRQSKESSEDSASLEDQQSTVSIEHIQTLSDVSEQSEDIPQMDDKLEEMMIVPQMDDKQAEVIVSEDVNKEAAKKREKEMRIEVCEYCGSREGRIQPCSKCRSAYHPDCINEKSDETPNSESFLCPNCNPLTNSNCCLCRQSDGELLICNIKLCGRRYHRNCLKLFHSPSAKQEKPSAQFTCPAHYCHTCVADLNELNQVEKKLLRCIHCPTAYHQSISSLITFLQFF